MEYNEALELAKEICKEYKSYHGEKLLNIRTLASLLKELPDTVDPETIKEKIIDEVDPMLDKDEKYAKIKEIIKPYTLANASNPRKYMKYDIDYQREIEERFLEQVREKVREIMERESKVDWNKILKVEKVPVEELFYVEIDLSPTVEWNKVLKVDERPYIEIVIPKTKARRRRKIKTEKTVRKQVREKVRKVRVEEQVEARKPTLAEKFERFLMELGWVKLW